MQWYAAPGGSAGRWHSTECVVHAWADAERRMQGNQRYPGHQQICTLNGCQPALRAGHAAARQRRGGGGGGRARARGAGARGGRARAGRAAGRAGGQGAAAGAGHALRGGRVLPRVAAAEGSGHAPGALSCPTRVETLQNPTVRKPTPQKALACMHCASLEGRAVCRARSCMHAPARRARCATAPGRSRWQSATAPTTLA